MGGVSIGVVSTYICRIFTVSYDISLEYIKWPDVPDRKQIAASIKDTYKFPSCVGCIEGTHVVLSQKLKNNVKCTFNRKQRYPINVQAICNHKKIIGYIQVGFPSCFSDSTDHKMSSVYKYPLVISHNVNTSLVIPVMLFPNIF